MPQFFTVTPKGFQSFVERVDYWQERLALTEWTCTQLRHSGEGPDGTSIGTSNAMISLLLANRCYVLTCNRHWAIPVTPENIDYVAFHEVCHLLLAELWDIAYSHCPPAQEEFVSNAEHAAIARLNRAFAPLVPRVVQLEPLSREDSVQSAVAAQPVAPDMVAAAMATAGHGVEREPLTGHGVGGGTLAMTTPMNAQAWPVGPGVGPSVAAQGDDGLLHAVSDGECPAACREAARRFYGPGDEGREET